MSQLSATGTLILINTFHVVFKLLYISVRKQILNKLVFEIRCACWTILTVKQKNSFQDRTLFQNIREGYGSAGECLKSSGLAVKYLHIDFQNHELDQICRYSPNSNIKDTSVNEMTDDVNLSRYLRSTRVLSCRRTL